VARNVAENLGRLGMPVTLLSAVGDDAFGRRILEATAAGGVDTSRVLVSRDYPSASYVAILDENGTLALAIDDMAVLQLITPDYIAAHRNLLEHARMIVMDANVPAATIPAVIAAAKKGGVPICVDPVSTTLAARLKKHLADFFIVTPNVAEAEVLCDRKIAHRADAMDAAHCLVEMGVDIAIITLGGEGLCYASAEESGHIPAIATEIVDPTGAGDALTAAVVYGLANDIPLDEAVRLGVSAATLTLQCPETVCPDLSLEHLYDQLVI
jgi:pseudouridine kinase